jgi:Dna[CI] antecedent DciA-like protein
MRAYQNLLAAQPLTAGKVGFAWTLAAGPTLGRAGSPRWSSDGTLIVRARDAAWLREIRRARPIIAERLGQLLGPGAVRRIIIE